MDGEGYSVSLPKRNDLRPRLHTRTLFCQHKFSTGKIFCRVGKQDRHLYRENVLAVNILMETIVITLAVLEQQGRRPDLPGMMASLNELSMVFRITDIDAHRAVPAIGDRRQSRINRLP